MQFTPDPKRPGRKIYALYDAGKAQDAVNAGHANKGAPMKITNKMAEKFALLVKDKRISPYDARCHLAEDKAFKNRRIPCVSTWYKHIRVGDIPVKYGEDTTMKMFSLMPKPLQRIFTGVTHLACYRLHPLLIVVRLLSSPSRPLLVVFPHPSDGRSRVRHHTNRHTPTSHDRVNASEAAV